ncbi:MAG: HD domain-containing phosphohydrolase [Burkholderiaceae bacterium]
MQPSKRQITAADIKLGEPLLFSVFDPEGRLLLRRGVVLTMPAQVSRIIERKCLMNAVDAAWIPPSAAPRAATPQRVPGEAMPVFEQMGSLILNLKHSLVTALRMPEQIDLNARIRQFAAKIQALCAEDVDSSLAAAHLDYVNPYIVVHQVMGAVLTEIVARRSGIGAQERLSLVCAALTRDIGMLAIQSELDQCRGPLSVALKLPVQAHPQGGVQILRTAGVDEQVWLSAVEQHHERLNGSGYPHAITAAAIGQGGRILAIADTFSAMTKPRPYRDKEHFAQSALRDIYLQKDVSLDGVLIQAMIKAIGIFPPGSIVKLKNGEVAVVKCCTHKQSDARVYTVYDQRGMPLLEPVRRNTANPDFEIVSMVPYSNCRSAAVTIKRVWIK